MPLTISVVWFIITATCREKKRQQTLHPPLILI